MKTGKRSRFIPKALGTVVLELGRRLENAKIIIMGLQMVCRDLPAGDVGVAIGAKCHGRPSPDYL